MATRRRQSEAAPDAAAGLTDPGVQTASSGSDTLSDAELKGQQARRRRGQRRGIRRVAGWPPSRDGRRP